MPVLAIRTRCTSRPSAGFTLIETLAVAAVTALLMALAASGIASARNAARDVACAARLTQPAMLLKLYAADNRDMFPRVQDISYGTVRPSFDPSSELEKTWVDLLVERGYISAALDTAGLPEVLTCPSAYGYENDPTWAGHMPHYAVNMHLSPPRRLEASTGQRSFFGRPFVYGGDTSKKIMMVDSQHLTARRGWFSAGNVGWIAMRHGKASGSAAGERGSSAGANVVYLDGHVAFCGGPDAASVAVDDQPFAGIHFWRQPTP